MVCALTVVFFVQQVPKGPVGGVPTGVAGMKRPGAMPHVGMGAEGTPPPPAAPTTPPLEQAVRRLAGPVLTMLAPALEQQGEAW